MKTDDNAVLRNVATEAFIDGYMQAANDIIIVMNDLMLELSAKDIEKIRTQLSMNFDRSFHEYTLRKSEHPLVDIHSPSAS